MAGFPARASSPVPGPFVVNQAAGETGDVFDVILVGGAVAFGVNQNGSPYALRVLAGVAGVQTGDTGVLGATLWSGSGLPAGGLGVNGDYYFRTDTPAVATQRLYVKSAGAWIATAA